MKLKELFTKEPAPQMDFKKYLKFDTKMPLMDTSKIVIEALIGSQRAKLEFFTGEGSLALYYKNKPGAILSLDEELNGEVWKIMQLQGIGKTGYRIVSGVNRELLLADTINEYAKNPESDVRQITMPQLFDIPGIEDARSLNIENVYNQVRSALGMKFSSEEGIFIVEVKKNKN